MDTKKEKKKYDVILADPPWDYGNTKNLSGGFCGMAEKHYETMELQDIKNIPVQNLTKENCYLFLWATSPFLQKSFEVIESWGFKYATVGFVWVKMTNDMGKVRGDGLGNYTNSNAEYCLIARMGRYWRAAKTVKQIILAPKTKHSEKPKEIYERIENLCGDLARIELFARDKRDGWDSWGNEIESDIEL